MSTKKYTNVEVGQIHRRLMDSLGLDNKTALAAELGTSLQNLKNREDRGVNKLDDVELLCSRKCLDRPWIFGEHSERTTNIPAQSIVTEQHERYEDPVAQAFLKDWLNLPDVIKMRVWTLVKEELEKQEKKKGGDEP